jgi:hypothetical protein
MIPRIERGREGAASPARRVLSRRAATLVPLQEEPAPRLALRYTNGFVTVEISHDALNAYINGHGDVPLPISVDDENGDRRAYDPRSGVRVIYDRCAKLREVRTKSRDGLSIRVNFPAGLDSLVNADTSSNEPLAQAV